MNFTTLGLAGSAPDSGVANGGVVAAGSAPPNGGAPGGLDGSMTSNGATIASPNGGPASSRAAGGCGCGVVGGRKAWWLTLAALFAVRSARRRQS